MALNEPSIYGIKHSNRKKDGFWGKNEFNSAFPVGLANYMRDQGIKAKYIAISDNLQPVVREIDISEVYNAGSLPNTELDFAFESKYEPYQTYAYDAIDGIDLIIKDLKGNYLRPLEVKLTVLPDNSTKKAKEERWGTEIVFRPPTTIYCALGMADGCRDNMSDIRCIFEDTCRKIQNWNNTYEISRKMRDLVDLLDEFERSFYQNQRPLIMQPIWRTEGQSPFLSENAFDLFIWSDYAFSRLFLGAGELAEDLVSRQQRSVARLARCLYEISKAGKVDINSIYRQMTFDLQTDKEFSVNGRVTNLFMRCERLNKPIVKKDELFNIILNGGEKKLKPERRFDQTVYFTMANRHRGEPANHRVYVLLTRHRG